MNQRDDDLFSETLSGFDLGINDVTIRPGAKNQGIAIGGPDYVLHEQKSRRWVVPISDNGKGTAHRASFGILLEVGLHGKVYHREIEDFRVWRTRKLVRCVFMGQLGFQPIQQLRRTVLYLCKIWVALRLHPQFWKKHRFYTSPEINFSLPFSMVVSLLKRCCIIN
jgi:hypothetical protein